MRTKGFTLIEIIVTMTIIALLSIMVISGYGQQQRRARDSRRLADGGSVGIAIESYKAAHGSYPANTTGIYTYKNSSGADVSLNGASLDGAVLEQSLAALVNEGLVNTLPKDPKGVAITTITSNDPPFCLNYSYQADTNAGMSGNTLASTWSQAHSPVPYVTTNPANQYVGPRAWVIRIATEMPADSQSEHPLDASIIATHSTGWCNSSRGYAYILGPKN